MKRYLYNIHDDIKSNPKQYGVMGEESDIPSVKVGDLVRLFYKKEEMFLIVVKDEKVNKFHAMGLWSLDLYKTNPRTILPHYLVTNEILAEHGLKYIEKESKKNDS